MEETEKLTRQARVVETDTAVLERNSDGVVIVRKKEDCFIELDHAKYNCSVHRDLALNSPSPCMIVMDEMQNTSPEALEYYSLPLHEEYRSAEAFVIEQLGVRMIVDHYMKTVNMSYPRATFATEKEALDWLKQYF